MPERILAAIRAAGVSPQCDGRRGRAVRGYCSGQTGRGLFVRAGDQGCLERGADRAGVLVPARATGEARGLCPGVQVVLLSVEHDARRRALRARRSAEAKPAGGLEAADGAVAGELKSGGVHREFCRPVAGAARDRRNRAQPHLVSGVRPFIESLDDSRSRIVLRRGSQERPESYQLRCLGFRDAQRATGQALRHPRGWMAGRSRRSFCRREVIVAGC